MQVSPGGGLKAVVDFINFRIAAYKRPGSIYSSARAQLRWKMFGKIR